MDFLIGLLLLWAIAYLITGIIQFFTRKPFVCSCGWQCYSEEEMCAHTLSKNIHRQVEPPKPQK